LQVKGASFKADQELLNFCGRV